MNPNTEISLRVPAPVDLKNSRLLTQQYKVFFQSYHSIAYNPTGTVEKNIDLKHSCMTFINNKRSKAVLLPT